MFRIFCCRTRHPNRVEVDEVTDSLEKCLTIERGAREFKLFLEKNHFNEESTTLAFAFKCQNILTEIQRLSPFTRATGLPTKIQNDIRNLSEMADNINFDLDQMNTLRNLNSPDTDTKETISKTSSENLNLEPGYHECYIMVQETKKIGGQCVKIRENFQGCVAGTLMDPFHQDCL